MKHVTKQDITVPLYYLKHVTKQDITVPLYYLKHVTKQDDHMFISQYLYTI